MPEECHFLQSHQVQKDISLPMERTKIGGEIGIRSDPKLKNCIDILYLFLSVGKNKHLPYIFILFNISSSDIVKELTPLF